MQTKIYELNVTRTQTRLTQVNEKHIAAMREVQTRTQRLQILDSELASVFITLSKQEKTGSSCEDLVAIRNHIKWLSHDCSSAQKEVDAAQTEADKVLKELERARTAHRTASERLKIAQDALRRAMVWQQIRRDVRVEEEVLEARAAVSHTRSAN